jgi:hypothetical protein
MTLRNSGSSTWFAVNRRKLVPDVGRATIRILLQSGQRAQDDANLLNATPQ